MYEEEEGEGGRGENGKKGEGLMGSDDDASFDSNHSIKQQQWQIIDQAFVQSNTPSRQLISINRVKHTSSKNRQQSSQPQSDEEKDQMMMHPDRSLKVEKPSKKQSQMLQLQHNKNKSLSSPGNNKAMLNGGFNKKAANNAKPSSHPTQKPTPHQHTSKPPQKPQKPHLNNPNPYTSKKTPKQKKISNGSLSTNHTKGNKNHQGGHATKTKPKISKRMIQEKQQKQQQQMLSKSNISQQSNQFLVLGEQLYDYEDMSKIPLGRFNPGLGSASGQHLLKKPSPSTSNPANKKVTFSYYQQHPPEPPTTSPHLASFAIYDESKLAKKLHNTIAKIQKYLLGFIDAETFTRGKQTALQSTENLSLQSKLQLYHTLLNDSELVRELEENSREQEMGRIDEVVRLSVEKVERKSEKLGEIYGGEVSLISKWKNSKLHQLSTAKRILERLVGEEDRLERQKKKRWEQKGQGEQDEEEDSSSQSESSFRQYITDINAIDDPDNDDDPLTILSRQLQLVMHQEYYPQLKKHTLTLRKTLTQLLKNEHFPQPKLQTQSETTQRAKMQDTKNYFTPNGVLWFFQKFFTFIIQKPNYIEQLVDRLNEGYGFDVQTKKVIARTKDLQRWYEFFGEGETSVNRKTVIGGEVLKEFQVKVIMSDPEIGEEMAGWMHLFNRAIVDCFNDQFQRYRPFYPYGQPIPFLQKPGKYFQITPESIFYFFQKCKFHVYTNYITFFAGLILPDGHQENKETKKYNLAKEVKMLNQDVMYDWEQYHCLGTVARLAVWEEVWAGVEQEVWVEVVKEMGQIREKRRLGL